MGEKALRVSFLILSIVGYGAFLCGFAEACRPPCIRVLSPEDDFIYAFKNVPLVFTVDKAVSWIGYSLDGQANVTISGNTTLIGLAEGVHDVIVYANDTFGRMGASCKVCFYVDTLPPNITDVCQFPQAENVFPEDIVEVNATVTDDVSGVKRVSLFFAYANASGVWIGVVDMVNVEGNVWSATIPSFPYCTNVTYAIEAEDNVGNFATTVEMGYVIQYHVIPEFQSFLILPVLIAASLLTSLFRKKKSCKINGQV
ncbi:MAG: hypothetical protein QXV21_05925 [Candidatus Bathyarchaeia archaeon]